MLDDILELVGEIAIDLGGEVLEAVIKRRRKRRKARHRAKAEARRAEKAERKRLAAAGADPWKKRKPKLPWEG